MEISYLATQNVILDANYKEAILRPWNETVQSAQYSWKLYFDDIKNTMHND